MLTIKITPNETSNPPGKLADAEIHFGPEAGILAGLKLIGFAVWERRTGGGRNVTFPARTYAVNGERRTFALVRPIMDVNSQETLRRAVLNTYERWEADAEAQPAAGPLEVQTTKHAAGNLSNSRHTSPVPVAREAANLETREIDPHQTRHTCHVPGNHPADCMACYPPSERTTEAPRDSRITSEAPPARKEATPPQDLF